MGITEAKEKKEKKNVLLLDSCTHSAMSRRTERKVKKLFIHAYRDNLRTERGNQRTLLRKSSHKYIADSSASIKVHN